MIILCLFSDQRPFKKYPWLVSIQAVMKICPNQEHCAKGELVKKKHVKRHGLRTHDGYIPNSLRSKFKFQSQIIFWGFGYKGSRFRNKCTSTIINFLTLFQGLRPYSGLHRAYFSSLSIRYKWGYTYHF